MFLHVKALGRQHLKMVSTAACSGRPWGRPQRRCSARGAAAGTPAWAGLGTGAALTQLLSALTHGPDRDSS